MKKIGCFVLLMAMLLSGCAQPALETVNDAYVTQPPAERMVIQLELPAEAAEAVMEDGDGTRLYLCDGYELRLQTLSAGNLDEVLRTVTGYGEDRLTVMRTKARDFERYDCVWCSAGEEGEQVGRTAILGDGDYFYCVTVMADSGSAYSLTPVWQEVLDSFSLG